MQVNYCGTFTAKPRNQKNQTRTARACALIGQSEAGCLQTSICSSVTSTEGKDSSSYLNQTIRIRPHRACALKHFVQSSHQARCPSILCEECKTSFSDGNANNYPNNTYPTCSHEQIDPKSFIWSKQVLLPTCKAFFLFSQNVLQKHDHKDVLKSKFDLRKKCPRFNERINKGFLFV